MKRIAVFVLIAVHLIPGCTHGRSDPAVVGKSSFQSPAYRSIHNPWGTLRIREVRDSRPARELGRVNYLRESFASDELYDRPVPFMIKRLLTVEMNDAGVFQIVEEDVLEPEFFLDVIIRHFYIKWDTSVLAVVPVLPSVDVEAELEFEVLLSDQDGRRFLDKIYRRRDSSMTTSIGNPKSTGESVIGGLLESFMAEFHRDSDNAIPDFWKALGRPVPESNK